ncbi:Uncharacterized protein PHSC3_000788 [Chlamydiales bacterium STE3]|nr:Uncharacterized protein PHSC3_000788 [Chlamydiales bacterium STE3]
MKFLRHLLFGAAALGVNILAAEHSNEHHEHHEIIPTEHHEHHHEHHNRSADNNEDESAIDERDWIALREFLALKREEKQKEQEKDERGGVIVSGDVRANFRTTEINERIAKELKDANGVEIKDPDGKPVLGVFKRHDHRRDANTEFNLRFNYRCNRTWAVSQVQFENDMGIKDFGYKDCDEDDYNTGGFFGGGDCDNICLRQAYIGYNLVSNPCYKVDVEFGRRGNLYHIFDSKVQFVSRLDGIIFKLSSKLDSIDWYLNAAGFAVDIRRNHYAWIAETGLYNIYDTTFDAKYSFIRWKQTGRNRCGIRDPKGFRFAISQFLVIYSIDPALTWNKPTTVYGAFLVNHDTYRSDPTVARRRSGAVKNDPFRVVNRSVAVEGSKYHSANKGWYVGLQFGKVNKQGDWMLDFRYQYVEAKAIPDGDVSGIGRGAKPHFTRNLVGNTNYKGWRIEGLYALTDCIQLDAYAEHSSEISKSFGGPRKYTKMAFDIVYSF